jgi:subtilisin family serine protease
MGRSKPSLPRSLLVGLLAATFAACGGGSSPATLTSVAVGPQPISLARGATLQLLVTGTYSDGSTSNLTSRATFSTSNPAIATVSTTGLVTGNAVGAANVGAIVGAVVGQATATVTLPAVTAIAVSPSTASVPVGAREQFTAIATYADGATEDARTRVTWTSSAQSLATLGADGLATVPSSATPGNLTVTAALNGVQGTSSLAVVARAAIGPQLTTDPLADQQWYLRNTEQKAFADVGGVAGMDLHLAATYAQGWTGAGVRVAVVDSGLEIAHEDLAANIGFGSWNFVTGTTDPSPPATVTDGDHGTSVSGIIAMVYDNGRGGMGVAPGASLNGYNFLAPDGSQTIRDLVRSLGSSTANPASSSVWVFNQSFGFDETVPVPSEPVVEAQYQDGVTHLRGGLGSLYVKAAGNGFRGYGPDAAPADCSLARALGVTCQNASMDGFNTLPYNVVVGALNANGVRSSYSTAGSALWVSAPGGEFGANQSTLPPRVPPDPPYNPYVFAPAMVTTDQSGCTLGYAQTGAVVSAFDGGTPPNDQCNYTNSFNGTSSATPSTSGAIALLLDARPTLTWREVKHILAHTARRADPTIAPVVDTSLAGGDFVAEPGWTVNAAGYAFHDWYGFGAVSVDDAVAMAQGWTSGALGTFADTGWIPSAPVGLAIPDASSVGATTTLPVPATPRNLTIEAVQVEVTVIHPAPGNLGIELVSPSGTRSVLLNIKNGFARASGLQMVLASNAFYGESAAGTWTLKVVDGVPADVGTLSDWKIRVYGH